IGLEAVVGDNAADISRPANDADAQRPLESLHRSRPPYRPRLAHSPMGQLPNSNCDADRQNKNYSFAKFCKTHDDPPNSIQLFLGQTTRELRLNGGKFLEACDDPVLDAAGVLLPGVIL